MSKFAENLVRDLWDGLHCKCEETANPSICEVVEAIDALDADQRTMITLFGPNGEHLVVGGGNGQYVCFISTSDDELWNLKDEHAVCENPVLLNVGGQQGDYLPKNVVDRDMIVQAATEFFDGGRRANSLGWERQN